MANPLPDYIEARIRQNPPAGVPVVPGSTPVVAFGNILTSRVATLGWNPSRVEFLDKNGNALVGEKRRLETVSSIGTADLARAPADAILRVFHACNNYFHGRPSGWFSKLERLLKHVGASYYGDSACHLDLVQWATDPVWGKLLPSHKRELLESDVPFIAQQLSQEQIQLLLLNGTGIVKAYMKQFDVKLEEQPCALNTRLKLFVGHNDCGLKLVGWNINLQTTPGVSNEEIETIGAAVSAFWCDHGRSF